MTLQLILKKYFYDAILKMAAHLEAGKMAQILKKILAALTSTHIAAHNCL